MQGTPTRGPGLNCLALPLSRSRSAGVVGSQVHSMAIPLTAALSPAASQPTTFPPSTSASRGYSRDLRKSRWQVGAWLRSCHWLKDWRLPQQACLMHCNTSLRLRNSILIHHGE
jgi:hypothetical protein